MTTMQKTLTFLLGSQNGPHVTLSQGACLGEETGCKLLRLRADTRYVLQFASVHATFGVHCANLPLGQFSVDICHSHILRVVYMETVHDV